VCVPNYGHTPAINDRISALDLLIGDQNYNRNGGLNMRWIVIILLAIALEFFVRFLTRNMEDKKKREKLLARIWLVFGVVLLVVWLINRFL